MEDIEFFLDYAIQSGQENGAEFIEARFDEVKRSYLYFENERVVRVDSSEKSGIGVTVYINGARGYGYTSSLKKEEINNIVKEAIKAAKASSDIIKLKADPKEYKPRNYGGFSPNVKKHPSEFELHDKIELAKNGIEAIQNGDISNIRTIYGELYGSKLFMNSEGLKRFWKPIMTGLLYLVVVKRNGNIGNGREGHSASSGLEIFDERSPSEIASKALKSAIESSEAKTLKSGVYPLITDPNFAGLVAHESFGHASEGDYVSTGSSILKGRIGEKIGSDHASIFESGDPINFGFWVPYDDEGVDTRKVTLLENGVLKSHLHSRSTANLLDQDVTGNARAINFAYPPIVRMRNTYFGPGEMSKEEIFELINRGVYAEGSSGGQTEDTGNFTFAANRAYWVENGEIAYPLKGIAVRGHILEFLRSIIGASKDLIVRTSILGGCGKGGQSPLPVGLGGPYLAVREAIIGGG